VKAKVYIETTVISYLTARPNQDVVIAGHQKITRDWWQTCQERFELVASVIGFLKGKSALGIARRVQEKERNFTGAHFWARGYAVSTVGFELESVKKYIREQEMADKEGRF
jgi:putative transposase